MLFDSVIGLEVHAQLKTKTKIFCSCSTEFGKSANANTCPVCIGMPGVLPVLNYQAVNMAIKACIATNCKINKKSKFDRKNYFYPDLPKGYQISQYEAPIAEHGFLKIKTKTNELKKIGITRIHMEEDAGKLIHDPNRSISMVDLNRAGTPLIEIVSEPDLCSASQAGEYLRKLHSILKYINVCDGNMEQGSFRCDANISLKPKGQKKLGTRTELKNLNSFKNVEKAILYEIQRQAQVLENNKKVVQQTRLWDPSNNKTTPMRGKEDAQDYRYFPEPDLTPLIIDDAWIQSAKKDMPELPEKKYERFINEYKLTSNDAKILISSIKLANFFEEVVAKLENKKQVANWIITNFLGMLNAHNISFEESYLSSDSFAKLLLLIEDKRINANAGKIVLEEMIKKSKQFKSLDPETIVKQKNLEQVSDQFELEEIINKIVDQNPDEEKAYKAGKTKLFSFFMGQIMKETKGKADPKIITKLLKNKL